MASKLGDCLSLRSAEKAMVVKSRAFKSLRGYTGRNK